MITDILTIIWKEAKELLFQRGNLRGGWVGLLVFVGVFGIFLPLQTGRGWVESPVSLIYWAWLPFLMVSSVIADSFAGERERHTLETLLASRLSDRAILFGKIGAAVAYGWGLTIFSVLLGIITVNVAYGRGDLLLYSPTISFGILGLSFLIATLAAGLGVLISLRAATVRQAQQMFSVGFFLFFIPMFLFPLLPDAIKLRIAQAVVGAEISQIIFSVMAVLLIVDIALVAAAMARFRRARLILD